MYEYNNVAYDLKDNTQLKLIVEYLLDIADEETVNYVMDNMLGSLTDNVKNHIKADYAMKKGTPIKDVFNSELEYVNFMKDSTTTFSKWEEVYNSLTTKSGKKEWIYVLSNHIFDGVFKSKVKILKFVHREFGDDFFTKKQNNGITTSWFVETLFNKFFYGLSDLTRFKIDKRIWFTPSNKIRVDVNTEEGVEKIGQMIDLNIPINYGSNIETQDQFMNLFEILRTRGIKDRERCPTKRALLNKLTYSLKQNDFYGFDDDTVDEIVLDIFTWNKVEAQLLISSFKKDKTQHLYTMLKL